MNQSRFLTSILTLTLLAQCAHAGDTVQAITEPVLERATLHSLGVYWIVRGDDNRNSSIALSYRKTGQPTWKIGQPLFRVERGAHLTEKYSSKLNVPADGWLFAGSALLLEPDTAYELKLALVDPDGGSTEKTLSAHTRAEPVAPANAPIVHVAPGKGGGSGTAANPYLGLEAAQSAAKPGDVILLHAGVYPGVFELHKYGQAGKPIVYRSAGDGEAILDAQGDASKRPGRCISASDSHDVWFEGLTLRNAEYGIVAHEAARIVIRRCHIHHCDFGITATRNDKDLLNDYFICDNLIEGPCIWPRTKGIEDPRGIQISGSGHDVCYNRVRNFSDAIDTFPSPRCCAIDIHHNDLSECTDDGGELDFSERNVRCFYNRYTNVFQGISVQPVFGGPIYVFRNALYNVVLEPFKMHNSPSGALMFHNTCVKKGMPLMIMSSEKVRNCVYRNNLFVGTSAPYAYEAGSPMADCDFDYDGFAGGPFNKFLKWNNTRYDTLDATHANAPVYKHAIQVDAATAFASARIPRKTRKNKWSPRRICASRPKAQPSTPASSCPESTTASPAKLPTWARTNSEPIRPTTARAPFVPDPPPLLIGAHAHAITSCSPTAIGERGAGVPGMGEEGKLQVLPLAKQVRRAGPYDVFCPANFGSKGYHFADG